MAIKPKIIMLDEPMAGCNAIEINSLMDLIRKINQDLGITIVIIEHFMKVLTELTEELLIIESVVSEKGRIIFNLIETDLPVIMAHSQGQFESN